MNLAAEMGKLPEPPSDSKPPLWDAWRHDLWTRAQQDDPRNFMKWPCIYHTMLQDHWRESIRIELDYIWPYIIKGAKPKSDDMLRLQRALGDKNPDPYFTESAAVDFLHCGSECFYDAGANQFDMESMSSSTYNVTHQAYHLLRWQDATGLRIADMQSIHEFGGGYGAMALVARRIGFAGKYYIYDLPEFALLQQWYLGECGVSGVEWCDVFDTRSVDLVIACYSLSETNFTERDRFLTATWSKSYLFLYSNKFEDYDNIAYFQRPGLARHLYGHNWAHSRIEHLPPESWYTFGWPEYAGEPL